jgi:DNA primase
VLSLRCAAPTLPMAAALSAAHLAAFILRPTVRRLYVARDNDAAGYRATMGLIERAKSAGVEAIALLPTLKDFNDDLRALGLRALRAALARQMAPEDVARFLDSPREAARGK